MSRSMSRHHYPPGFIPEIVYPDDSHKRIKTEPMSRSRSRLKSRDNPKGLPPIDPKELSETGRSLIEDRKKGSPKSGGKKTKKRRPKNK